MPVLLKRRVIDRVSRRVAPRHSSPTPSPAGPTQPTIFRTVVRGTRHRDVRNVCVGDALRCTRQPDNPADANALLLQLDAAPVGYLPREVSCEVAPWIDANELKLSVVVTRIASKRTGVEIQITVEATTLSPDANAHASIEAAVKAAAAAAEATQGLYSDAVLGRNLGVLIRDVRKHFSHILHPQDCAIYDQLSQLSHQASAFISRLYSRSGTWFRVTRLTDVDQDTADKRIIELMQCGFLISTDGLPLTQRLSVSIGCLTLDEIKQFLRELRRCGIPCRLTGNRDALTGQLERMLQEV